MEDLSIGALADFADQLVLGSDIEHFFGADHALDEEIRVLWVFVVLLFARRRSHNATINIYNSLLTQKKRRA